MKAIRIYTQDSKYYMEDLDTNQTVEVTEITKDGISLILPENSANRQYCSIKRAEKGITLEHKDSRTLNTTGTPRAKTPKIDLNEYYTDEEKAQVEKLQAKIDKINEAVMTRAQADLKKKELKETLMSLDIDTLKSIMAEINGGEA
jgi:hypothetical protein